MNRYVFYIVTCVFIIVMSVCFLLYVLWDAGQPKTGPVGNGVHMPTFRDLWPIYSTILMGVLNLPLREHKRKMT
jgi:hypothetical protein